MTTKIKILIGILVVIIIVAGGWWVWNHYRPPICSALEQQMKEEIEKANYCNVDEDCIAMSTGGKTGLLEVFGCWVFINKNADLTKFNEAREDWVKNGCSSVIDACLPSPLLTCISNKCTQQPTQAVTIATDKTEYKKGETVKITIKNNGTEAIMPSGFSNSFGFTIESFRKGNWISISISHCFCPVPGGGFVDCELVPIPDLQPGEIFETGWGQQEAICSKEILPAPPGKYRAVVTYKAIIYNDEISYSENEKISFSNEFTIK